MKRPFLLGLIVPAILALAAAPVALGAEPPPRISLGSLEGVYIQIRPWIALAFVAMGLVAAVSRLWQVLGMVGGTSLLGTNSGQSPTIGGVFTNMLLIVGTVAAAILLLYTWVDIVNAAIGIFWSIMDGSTPAPAAPAATPPPVEGTPVG